MSKFGKKVKCQNLETKGLMSKFGNKCQNDVWVYKSKYVLKISLISFFLRDSYRLSLISSILQKKKQLDAKTLNTLAVLF